MADRYCTNCGQELSNDARFCSSCGRPAHQTAAVATPETDVDVPPPPEPRTDEAMSPAKGEIEVNDYLVVLLGWPAWMIAISFGAAAATPGVGNVGAAAGAGVVENFLLYAPIAAVLTYLTLRHSRSSRRKVRHEARVREARDEFYLKESKKRDGL